MENDLKSNKYLIAKHAVKDRVFHLRFLIFGFVWIITLILRVATNGYPQFNEATLYVSLALFGIRLALHLTSISISLHYHKEGLLPERMVCVKRPLRIAERTVFWLLILLALIILAAWRFPGIVRGIIA